MKKLVWAVGFSLLICLILLLLYRDNLWLNHYFAGKYPIHGVDVSSYQGEINWDTLVGKGISFAFIKATEGSSYTDQQFACNWENAGKTSLRIGAYHFFSYDSSGQTQAEHFIRTVSKKDGMLPPVIDIEFYGNKDRYLPDKQTVQENLDVLIKKLEEYYGMRPIIYATKKSYALYISGSYPEYDIWIRDVYAIPSLPDGKAWTFWQYSDRQRSEGTNGKEKRIDMNVFRAGPEEFAAYATDLTP